MICKLCFSYWFFLKRIWKLSPSIRKTLIWYTYLFLYVNYIIFTTSTDNLRKSIISLFNSKFAKKNLGTRLSCFLDILVARHVGGLFLSHKKYAKNNFLNVLLYPRVSHVLPQLIQNWSLAWKSALQMRIHIFIVVLQTLYNISG